MGNSLKNQKKDLVSTNLAYLKHLKIKRRKFISQIVKEKNHLVNVNFSFISEGNIEELDWKLFIEDYLIAHKNTCFWANPLLTYSYI